MLPLSIKDDEYKPPRLNLLRKVSGWFRSILADKTSRNLFFFLCLNLSFAFVELLYGIWSNSLGLISDSFHMFFDCTALLAGLAASVISKWRSNDAFSYGYVRAEVLAGFVNGLFLIFTAFFIFSEGVERALEPPDVHHERLLPVSVLGFIVNLIGIFVFQHGGHGHSHGSGRMSITFSTGMNTAILYLMVVSATDTVTEVMVTAMNINMPMDTLMIMAIAMDTLTVRIIVMMTILLKGWLDPANRFYKQFNAQEVSEQQLFWKDNSPVLLYGVFLHIVADTLGSIGVIISAILMQNYGLMIADPICSMLIALLIGVRCTKG
ncbi:hypothetical protein QYF61_008906 [Mycteria americana]|uniref:Zinc transporter n=1 Tax=Mycteria americana TaxID=33587 RepID=A0AAN7RWW7_MYCAM|nr:hypothetical protein QYF61_008906 [Mycteria americana]